MRLYSSVILYSLSHKYPCDLSPTRAQPGGGLGLGAVLGSRVRDRWALPGAYWTPNIANIPILGIFTNNADFGGIFEY